MESHIQLQSFTLFPTLPTELRLKIWQCVIPGPRDVTIQYRTKYEEFNGKNVYTFVGWTSHDPVPLVLHICHESRAEGLKSYQPSFGSYFHQPKIYFDFSKDTLSFTPRMANGDAPPSAANVREGVEHCYPRYMLDVFLGGGFHGAQDPEKIQFMSVDIDDTVYGLRKFIWDEIRRFSALRALTIVPWEDDILSDELMLGYEQSLAIVAREHPEWSVPKITVVTAQGIVWGTLKVQVRG